MPTENPITREYLANRLQSDETCKADYLKAQEAHFHTDAEQPLSDSTVFRAGYAAGMVRQERYDLHLGAPLHITHRPLIRNAIGLLGMRRPVAPDVERVINSLEAMLEGQPTPADAPSAEWLYVAELTAGQAEDAAGSSSVLALLGAALKRLTFAARTSGGTAGPDAELMAACEQAEHALSLGGVGQAYMAGANSLTTAAQDVLAERNRQITAEGWTPEHDDQHDAGELAVAAGCYAIWSGGTLGVIGRFSWKSFFPWDWKRWKPSGSRRNLVKAGALILAEIERLDRAAALQPVGIDSEGGSHD